MIQKTHIGVGLVLAILFLVGILSHRIIVASRESNQRVRHTYDVLENLEGLLSTIRDVETAYHGFALMDDRRFLESYRAAVVHTSEQERSCRALIADNPAQIRRLAALAALAQEKVQFGDTVIHLRQAKGQAAAIEMIRGEQDLRLMAGLREILRNMEDEEHHLLSQRDADAELRSSQIQAVFMVGSLLGVLLACGTGWIIQRGLISRTHAGDSLRDSEEKYRMLLDGVHDYAIFMLGPQGQIVSWNAGAQRVKGYTAEEIIGHNFSCFFPPEDIKRGRPDEILRLTAASGRQEEEGLRVRKDGSRFYANIIFTALRDPAGNLRGFSEFCHDLSETKASGARYRGLLEAAPDAMVVVNQAGEIVLLNVQAEKRFGYRRDELIGQKVKNIIPHGFAERLIADGTRSAADALAQQIGTGIELSGQRKDGTEFPIEIMLSPLESVEGILVTAAIRDISVRKNAEKHLAQMEGRYRGLLEAAPDAMVVVNHAGEIVLLNVQAEKRFGYRRDELIGQKVKNIIPEGFAERLVADALRSAADALAQQLGTGIELSGRRKDGSEFPIEIMLSPLENAQDSLVTAVIRDITTRKKAEANLLQKVEELKRSNEELAQFANIASHDLQEPLRMVASYTQLLSSRYKGKLDSDADEFISFAVDGATRMQRLIQDLLAYSHIGTKGKDLVNTSSEKALQQALINLSNAIEESGALVTHDPLPTIQADETQLVQLFQNLVGNGIKYQTVGVPQVHISAVKNGAQNWMFSVRDNGVGIDSQYFEKIFGMFQRLHKREEFAGTGIGLAICKKIVERHGGSISVESQPGHGSTFHFALAGSETKL